jgi:2-polyprenyl-6-methoxyphenol hydroxylase-like FAD-dependent oxidoreductase
MGRHLNTDVAVVGGSLAGCAAACRLARAGLQVVVLEKSPDPMAYKRLCGHYIQAGAADEIARLGLAADLEAAGAVRNGVDVLTPFGWIRRPDDMPHGYSLRRIRLDPLVRALAAGTPGVTYVGGMRVVGLAGDGDRVAGADARDARGRTLRVRARLVVGADGRSSTVARLAGAATASSPNARFCYFAYYEGLPEPGRVWRLGRDVVLAVPNDDGLTVVAAFGHRSRLGEFAGDPGAALEAMAGALPDAPPVQRARRVSKVLGYKHHDNLWRSPAPRPGLALVGDAAMSLDPVPAIGCGWALQSAGWLADAVQGEEALDAAVARYAAEHERQLGGHRALITEGALAVPPSEAQALLLRAATRDREAARLFADVATRRAPAQELLTPQRLGRLREQAG